MNNKIYVLYYKDKDGVVILKASKDFNTIHNEMVENFKYVIESFEIEECHLVKLSATAFGHSIDAYWTIEEVEVI
jgi:glutathionylspermidine synthase